MKTFSVLLSSRWLTPLCLIILLFCIPSKALPALPPLDGNGGFIGATGPIPPPNLAGKVVLFDFWDYTCINCIRTFPHLNHLYQKYGPKGLVIIAIHSPEFSFAGVPERVEHAIRHYHLLFPVVMDKEMVLWNRFHNHYWPADYLYDRSGALVYHAFGEGGYDLLENQIRTALHLSPNPLSEDETDFPTTLTPELYAGYERGHIGNPSGYRRDRVALYAGHPSSDKQITLHGMWKAEADHITALKTNNGKPAALTVLYNGRGVNAVLKRSSFMKSFPVLVLVDGKPLPIKYFGRDLRHISDRGTGVYVKDARMYSLVSGQPYGAHRIDLLFPKSGIEVYTMTFNP